MTVMIEISDKEPLHRFKIGDKVIWKSNHRLKGIVKSQSIGWNPPLAYVEIDKNSRPTWISESDLEKLLPFNPSRRKNMR